MDKFFELSISEKDDMNIDDNTNDIDDMNDIDDTHDIDYDSYLETFLLYNSDNEKKQQTMLRYKRYQLYIGDWEGQTAILQEIEEYIENPNKKSKKNIDKSIIEYFEKQLFVKSISLS